MSLMVTGIGVLGVVALLPLAFVRAVQATNLTNGTILRYNAESLIDINPRLLLRWQPNTAYSNTTPNYLDSEGVPGSLGDLIINPNFPNVGFQCTARPAGISGPVQPTWNTTVGQTTTDGSCVWTTVNIPRICRLCRSAFRLRVRDRSARLVRGSWDDHADHLATMAHGGGRPECDPAL